MHQDTIASPSDEAARRDVARAARRSLRGALRFVGACLLTGLLLLFVVDLAASANLDLGSVNTAIGFLIIAIPVAGWLLAAFDAGRGMELARTAQRKAPLSRFTSAVIYILIGPIGVLVWALLVSRALQEFEVDTSTTQGPRRFLEGTLKLLAGYMAAVLLLPIAASLSYGAGNDLLSDISGASWLVVVLLGWVVASIDVALGIRLARSARGKGRIPALGSFTFLVTPVGMALWVVAEHLRLRASETDTGTIRGARRCLQGTLKLLAGYLVAVALLPIPASKANQAGWDGVAYAFGGTWLLLVLSGWIVASIDTALSIRLARSARGQGHVPALGLLTFVVTPVGLAMWATIEYLRLGALEVEAKTTGEIRRSIDRCPPSDAIQVL